MTARESWWNGARPRKSLRTPVTNARRNISRAASDRTREGSIEIRASFDIRLGDIQEEVVVMEDMVGKACVSRSMLSRAGTLIWRTRLLPTTGILTKEGLR